MSGAAAGAAGAAAAQAAIANAIKASGVLVRVDETAFRAILARIAEPLVVHAEGGFFSTHYQYLTSYRGLAFVTKTQRPIPLPSNAEVVLAKKISLPD